MHLVEVLIGFLGGSLVTTLVQVRAEWRRRRAERVTTGAEAFLAAVDQAIGALDAVAEAGGDLHETDRRSRGLFGEIEKTRSALTEAPAPKQLGEYNALFEEMHHAMRWPGRGRAAVAREAIERVERALPEVLKDIENDITRGRAAEIGRALTRNSIAAVELLELHLDAHKAIDSARRQRSRLALSFAEVPTRSALLVAADRVVAALRAFQKAIDEAVFQDQDPRSQGPVIKARADCGREIDGFCVEVADAVGGKRSRRWRWRL
jgi:hypothetical protein